MEKDSTGEHDRLQDLKSYKIWGSLPDKELDELTQIASAICDTPISLISLIDDQQQWFKSKKGLEITGSPIKEAFCQHTLNNPHEVLVVEDALEDERFQENSFVHGALGIRFYAGAPLQTPLGNVLGTLCILDYRPRTISQNQKNGLKLLAKKTMDFFESRKLLMEQNKIIDAGATNLKKLADQVPGVIYQLEINAKGEMTLHFVSKGLPEMFPGISAKNLMANPILLFDLIHPDDLNPVQAAVEQSFIQLVDVEVEYRVIIKNSTMWHWAKAKPERKKNGSVVWYGTFQNVTHRKEYEQTLEEILSHISHVIRRPVTTMLALSSMIDEDNLDEERIREYARNFKTIAEEMDSYIQNLNNTYYLKMQRYKLKKGHS